VSTPSVVFGPLISPRELYKGPGYLAGELPPDPNPDELDGRARILNVPSRVRIVVFDRSSLKIVTATRSAPDGTWLVDRLDPSRTYMVIGLNDAGTSNGAIQDWIVPALPED
jgi:hypothetical protein